jgi:NADPH-dependent 2,4-dienoyl-CoA reductase/sulfur reductase-like enzyme
MRRIVVVGGSLAGVHAAEALRERGFDGELTLVSADPGLPYDRPPLSKELLLEGKSAEQLLLRPASWYEEQGIGLRLGTAARGLDAAGGRLALSDGSEIHYDGMVLATGSVARRLPAVPEGARVHVIRTLENALELRPELVPGRHLVMIGGGFIGLEVAGVARRLGLDVTLIEGSSTPLARVFGREVGDWYRELHERNGVRLVCDSSVDSLESTPGGITLSLNSGERINGDVVVAGIGSTPAVDWLAGSAVEISNGVACTPELLTSAPNIVAAGDIARWRNPVFDEEMRVEHWSNAVDQGRHVAATLLGGREPFASVPYFWTDQHDTKMRFVGRAAGATDTRIETISDDKLVVTLGRDGVLTGALCVCAPRQLAKYKVAIQNRAPWEDVAELRLAPTG